MAELSAKLIRRFWKELKNHKTDIKEAKMKKTSLSKWIGNLIKDKLSDEWPEEVKDLAGAWPDFPGLKEIRRSSPSDLPREEL